MKRFCLIIFCFITLIGNAQKGGYDVIKIGDYFFDQIITDKYTANVKDSFVFRLEGKTPKFICDEGVDYLDVEFSPDSTVTKIELYTIGKLYPEANEFLNNYRKISDCMVSAFGKPDYFDNGKNKKEGQMTVAWLFPESKIMFILYTFDIPSQINQVKRLFKMVWTTYNPKEQKKIW